MRVTNSRVKFLLLVVLLGAGSIAHFLPEGAAAQDEKPDAAKLEFFEARVRPLLVTNCYDCHTDSAKGGLRLDSRAALLKGGQRGPALVPGNPAESLLIKAIAHTHETLRMPKAQRNCNRRKSPR